VSLLLCDVDNLKAINDERGHDAGDRALGRVAEALVAAAADHPGSVVGRLSGDEFCVLIEGAGMHAAREVGSAALRALAADRDMPVSISCGAAARDAAARTPEQLLRAADAAQYAAKRKGGGQVCTASADVEPLTAGEERRAFRGSPEQRVRGALELLQDRLDGELATAPALDRLEAVAATTSEAVNAAGWTVSWLPAGSSLIQSIANANSRDVRLRGVRVGLEHEIYPLEDYPATAALVARASGAFLTRCDDPHADRAECDLLRELGYEAVVVAAAGDHDGVWMIEVYGDEATAGLEEARPALALLTRAAVPPPGGGRADAAGAGSRRDRRHELLIALSGRLAAAEREQDLLDSVVEELERAFQGPLCAVLRVTDGVLENVACRGDRWVDTSWTLPAYAGLVGRCLRDRQPVLAGDVRAEPDFRDMAPALDVRSELAVPVFVGERSWGAIDLESEQLEAFDGEDARVVEAVAAQLGAALARLGRDRAAGDALTAS
jgi:diguanylate cyclase (GGDEF)-like protein